MPGYNLAAIDDTDIETVFDYVAFLLNDQRKKNSSLMQINGRWYKKVDGFRK